MLPGQRTVGGSRCYYSIGPIVRQGCDQRPRSVMNSRRLLRNSIQKTPVESMIAVSWIRVRSAYGNSFDHLVGTRE